MHGQSQEGTNIILFEVNWCLINILNNALHLVCEQHFNSYFYKKPKSVMGLKVRCVLILWLGLEIKTPKSNQHSLEFGTTLVQCLLLFLLIRCGYISYYF
jgi:hypothetical protein